MEELTVTAEEIDDLLGYEYVLEYGPNSIFKVIKDDDGIINTYYYLEEYKLGVSVRTGDKLDIEDFEKLKNIF